MPFTVTDADGRDPDGVWAGLLAFYVVRLVGMLLRTRSSHWTVRSLSWAPKILAGPSCGPV